MACSAVDPQHPQGCCTSLNTLQLCNPAHLEINFTSHASGTRRAFPHPALHRNTIPAVFARQGCTQLALDPAANENAQGLNFLDTLMQDELFNCRGHGCPLVPLPAKLLN